MKKKIFSVLGILILGLNTVFCQAVSISYDSLDSQNGEFYIDEEYSQESFKEEENILENDEEILIINSSSNTQESSLLATENNYIDKKVSRINLLNSGNENFSENLSIPENLDYTTVDITNVFTGNIISHDCNLYLISNFDETEHWNECTICGKILNKESHAYQDAGWTGGSANICANENVHQFICDCRANYNTTEGKKEHTWQVANNPNLYTYNISCTYDNQHKEGAYHYCQKADGSRINCSNLGKCSLCGYNYTKGNHRCDNYGIVNELRCNECKKILGTLLKHEITYVSEGVLKYNSQISITGSYSSLKYTHYRSLTQYINISGTSGSQAMSSNINFIQHFENSARVAHIYTYTQNSVSNEVVIFSDSFHPEYTSPVITDIISNSGEWTTDSTIIISGTENYCSSVNLTLKDTEGNIYAENVATSVSNKNWNYEIKPNLESKENTEFILQVTDTIGNTTEQSFYISKIDTVPPKAIENETLNTAWSKTKDYVFISSDYGIGNVSNSVIDTNNYEPATENENIFYKGYTFTGDVYGETLVPVYMKDGLGNQNVEFVSVSNLDNTAPSVEDIVMNKTLHNTEVVISANDINEKLNATGSGVTGYAISKENNIPSEFQEENVFNLTESGKYYLFVTDAVENITSRELNIPVQYKVTINPDGGTWKGDTNPQEINLNSDETIYLYPEPEKEGYTFKEWNISGNGELDEEGNLIISGDVQVTPVWEANKYSVTFIDYDVTHNRIMNTTIREIDFNSEISGSYIGSNISDNAYYKQYKLISDTSVIISTNPENNVVYRYFEFCYTEKESHINFNDNNNEDCLRPETYKLQLILEDGTLIDKVELPTTQPDYVFKNLPKYDEQGEEYNYKIIPIISDRYTPEPPDEDGNITITYSSPACCINIPKTTTLDGKDGDLTYTIQITSNLFYKDKIIIIPEEHVILTDGVKNMNATIIQDKTEFNKDDINNNSLRINGKIQTTKKYFAGVWKGTFNFGIKYEVSN